jgi:hypothetical protein
MVRAAHCWDLAGFSSYLIIYTVGMTTWKGCIKSKSYYYYYYYINGLCSPLLGLGRFLQLRDPVHSRYDYFEGGAAQHKASTVTYTQENTNTE